MTPQRLGRRKYLPCTTSCSLDETRKKDLFCTCFTYCNPSCLLATVDIRVAAQQLQLTAAAAAAAVLPRCGGCSPTCMPFPAVLGQGMKWEGERLKQMRDQLWATHLVRMVIFQEVTRVFGVSLDLMRAGANHFRFGEDTLDDTGRDISRDRSVLDAHALLQLRLEFLLAHGFTLTLWLLTGRHCLVL